MTPASDLWLYNGEWGAAASVQDRAFAYGDGLFETLLLNHASCPFAPLHWRRLLLGCERLAIPLDKSRIAHEFTAFLHGLNEAGVTSGVVKLIVSRGNGGKGYYPSASAANTLWQYRELPADAAQASKGIALAVSDIQLAQQPILAGLKHLNRLENVLAAQRASAEREPLLLDVQGRVIEAVSHNVFAVIAGQVITPKLDQCGVAGVLRQWLMDNAGKLGISFVERDIPLDELIKADEIFVGNSVRGIWPVRQVDAQTITLGPVCKALQAYHHDFLVNYFNA